MSNGLRAARRREHDAMMEAGVTSQVAPAVETSDIVPKSNCWNYFLLSSLFGCFGIYFILEISSNILTGDSLDSGVMMFLLFTPCALMVIDCFCCHCNGSASDSNDENGGSKYPLCPLCQNKIKADSYASGFHHQECLRLNGHLLNAFPILYPNAKCPRYIMPLPVWPADRCEKFECTGCYTATGSTQNTGANLFRCFRCNYDLCLNCVRGTLNLNQPGGQQSQQRLQQSLQTQEQLQRQVEMQQQQIQQLQQQQQQQQQQPSGPPSYYAANASSTAPPPVPTPGADAPPSYEHALYDEKGKRPDGAFDV